MTATTTRPKAPARIHCTVPGCTHSVDNAGSLPAHIAMAHKDVPMDAIAPKRSARNGAAMHHAPASDSPTAPAEFPRSAGAAALAEIPLDLVDVGDNVRVDVAELEELAASIAEHGVLQPVKVTGPHPDGRYRVVWGQRRVLASRAAARTTIAAIVQPPAADVDDAGAGS